MSKIIIDPDEITGLVEEGGEFVFSPSAEESLLELLKLQEAVDDAVETVKNRIAEAGLKINPNFRGVVGDSVRCVYRQYGQKYGFSKAKIDNLEPFLERKDWYTVKADKVEEYAKEVGELPEGIFEKDRENKLSIMRKE